ncbi:hypothetical protein ADK65_25710 [Streptomyces sp. NRRL B-1140]|uniref:hypothetical protein n=1 Tax=Streptomyces TaxID=1883 RepID=UPI0006AE4BAD|nr:hypothetical protein [Streptomyces sp. NRRL B-1140]KOV97435.1 hypothetical protein ADK65_25710 [Streptomyces sp. NRRL B-1140]
MTSRLLMFLMLVLGMGILFSALAGLIGYGISRLLGAPVDKAIGWGSMVAFSIMSLWIALLAVVVPLIT